MRIGLHIGKFHWPGSPENIGRKLSEIARVADEGGVYSVWVMDHLFQLGDDYGEVHGPEDSPMLEGCSTIAFMSAATHHIRLGLLVACNAFRHPGVLIKTLSSLDVLSGGRTYFGIGAGWFEREAQGLGIPFPSTWKERFDRLDETLRIAHHMWAGRREPFLGTYYQLSEPLNSPQPIQQPHPPILIGGGGEKRTLRLVAQYADASNFVIGSPSRDPAFGLLQNASATRDARIARLKEGLGRKLAVLEQHCGEVGRRFEEIEKTVVTYVKIAPGFMDPVEVVDECGWLGELGFDHVIFNMPNVDEITPLEVLAERVLPEVGAF